MTVGDVLSPQVAQSVSIANIRAFHGPHGILEPTFAHTAADKHHQQTLHLQHADTFPTYFEHNSPRPEDKGHDRYVTRRVCPGIEAPVIVALGTLLASSTQRAKDT